MMITIVIFTMATSECVLVGWNLGVEYGSLDGLLGMGRGNVSVFCG